MDKKQLDTHKPSHWGILRLATVELKMEKSLSYSDREWMHLYQEGVEKQDYNKQYQMIEALERGCGVLPDSMMEGSLQTAFQEDSERLFALMEEKTDLLQLFFYLHQCSKFILLFFTRHQGHHNALFLYECCRQLIHIASTDEDIQALQTGLIELSALDEAFWRRWLQKQEYHAKWLKLLPGVLGAVPESALRVYANVLPIQRDVKDIAIITQAILSISPHQIDHVIQTITSILCKRWAEYLKNEKEKGHFHNTMVFTAYTNVILNALAASYSTPAACQAGIIQKATALEQDLNGWFESITRQRTCFFVDLTDLYLLLCLYSPEQFTPDSAFTRAIQHTQWLLHRYDYLWEEDDVYFEKAITLLEQFSSKMKI